MEELRECNLCGSTHHVLFAEKTGRHTGETFRIVRCRDCGLVFVNPRLSEAQNQALYDEDYFNGKGFDASKTPRGHYGLINMRERAHKIGGEVEITTAPDQGTRVTLSLPLARNE